MRFMTTWTFKPEQADATTERFRQTGGVPPEGVRMIARYHDVSGNRGWAISETDDAVAIATWCRQWNDVLTFDVVPILDDQELAAVLSE